MFPCGHCHICHFVEGTGNFTDADRQKVYSIKHFINCSTAWVLYILECPYKKIYVGKTKRQLGVRIGKHLSSIRNPRNQDNPERAPIAQHFDMFHNSSPDGLRVKGFFALTLSNHRGDFDTVLLLKEKVYFWLQTMIPKGLNTEFSLQVFLDPLGSPRLEFLFILFPFKFKYKTLFMPYLCLSCCGFLLSCLFG